MENTFALQGNMTVDDMHYSVILNFLNQHAGERIAKASETSTRGSLAYRCAQKLAKDISEKLSDFDFYDLSKWQVSGKVREYVWIQFKRPKYKHWPISLSVSSTEKIDGKHHFKVHIESEDKESDNPELRKMLCNAIVDVDPPSCDFYYLGTRLRPSYKRTRLGNRFEDATVNLENYYKITTNIDVIVADGETNSSILERIVAAFKQLIPAYDAIFGDGPKNESWIIPCDCEKYDVIKAFSKHDTLDWHLTLQTKNIQKGDIVYIYVGKPFSRLMYKCEVAETGLPKREIDDSEFVKVPQECWEGESFRIRLIDKLDGLDLSLEDLNRQGVKGHIQCARKLEEQAVEYVEKRGRPSKVFKAINREEMEQLSSLSEHELEVALDRDDASSGYVCKEAVIKVRKFSKEIIDNLKAYYCGECQLCGDNVGAAYGKEIVEAHHIEYFSKTQNNDASNIIILCPNCHRLIHICNPSYSKQEGCFEFEDGKKVYIKNLGHLKLSDIGD